MIYGSICSGIEAASVAWEPLGWEASFFSEIAGFPDDHTRIMVKGKPASDTPQYHAYGNSMAVPVIRWIGERIQVVEGLVKRALEKEYEAQMWAIGERVKQLTDGNGL